MSINVQIPTEPSYYGSDCTQEDADSIAESLSSLIRNQFPGIATEIHVDGRGSGKTTGPNEAVVERINLWIETNWTTAL